MPTDAVGFHLSAFMYLHVHESCASLYFSLVAADHFDAIIDSSHTTLNRFAMLARACEHYAFNCALSNCDAYTLASVGFGETLFRDSPVWLKFYCAKVIEFIKYERKVLPQCRKAAKDTSVHSADSVSKIEADGVYGLRLQNLAITVDRVLSFLRRHPNHQLPPLHQHTDAEVAQKLVFGEFSVWSKFKDFVERQRSLQSSGLKETLERIKEGVVPKHKPLIEAAREVLRSTAAALRTASPTYHPVAAVLEVQPFSLLMVLLFFIMRTCFWPF
jgi:hypothetical protein